MARNKKKPGAEWVDEARSLAGDPEVKLLTESEAVLRFEIGGSVTINGVEYSFDEKVEVTAGRCYITNRED